MKCRNCCSGNARKSWSGYKWLVPRVSELESFPLLVPLSASLCSAMSEPTSSKEEQWSVEETQLLIKAITLYPTGTVRR